MNTESKHPIEADHRSVPRHDADQTFPAVLVNSTLATMIGVAGVWLTAAL